MFGIPSIGKLLILGLVIAGVYLFFKAAGRREQSRGNGTKRNGGHTPSQNQGNQDDNGSLDMVQCPACKAYIPAKSKCSCGGNG
ncbi:hypothetical protein WH95_02795 [Kiloniella litopenaei]|uniref:Uncharacterized protein n=1 Tax=Kiloniella litopenaei TaxID=1549748 RepID=A0A0M2RE33_9PROT|nr:hypothetical protein [Kiloniella litopenaei]KKJ78260.1 hypothetical protein WH95_02795 [Kiloniella litopenaei]